MVDVPVWIVVVALAGAILTGVLLVLELFALTVLILAIKNLVQELREHADPLISKANSLMVTANEVAGTVQGQTEHIAETTAHTTDVVANRVERTSRLLQNVVTSPIIASSAAMAGVRRGLAVWRAVRDRRQGLSGS